MQQRRTQSTRDLTQPVALLEILWHRPHDRKALGLPQAQLDLASKVVTAQPYTVAILVNGGALAIEPLLEGASAVVSVVEAFYPAQAGATAIVQTLLGQSNRFSKDKVDPVPAAISVGKGTVKDKVISEAECLGLGRHRRQLAPLAFWQRAAWCTACVRPAFS